MSTIGLQEIRQRLVDRHQMELGAIDCVMGLALSLTGTPEAAPRAVEGNGKSQIADRKSRKGKSKKRPAGGGRRATGVDPRSLKMVLGLARLPQPFGFSAVAQGCGISMQASYAALSRCKAKGWLVQDGKNQYRRTPQFPAVDEGEKRVAIPGLDAARPGQVGHHVLGLGKTKSELEDDLGLALRARDSALAAGQTGLHRILQDKVNGLQARLTALK